MLRPEAAAALVLLLVWPGAGAERNEPPPCKEGRECFDYTLVCAESGYEARLYPASTWVGTRVNGSAYLPSVVKSFWRLFHYIQGRNQLKVHIPMTSPVLTRVKDEPGSQEFEVYFMVPRAFQELPPTPTEDTVFLERFPELRIYARYFGGWLTDENRKTQLHYLDGKLSHDGRATQAGQHFTAGYNSPMELFKRRNEVWRLADGDLGCSPTSPE
ncbi:heme-binding protein 2-like [Elgaria multicarinata webbii]|uniref:heme-binding protein 2-like n=1 Tax=Elgaria multicarinata webbii TaxID=159646 RepID=UPI002FCD23BE